MIRLLCDFSGVIWRTIYPDRKGTKKAKYDFVHVQWKSLFGGTCSKMGDPNVVAIFKMLKVLSNPEKQNKTKKSYSKS